MAKNKPAGQELSGVISDRIRSGDIKANINPERGEETPSADAVRNGSGRGLGEGSTGRRGGN